MLYVHRALAQRDIPAIFLFLFRPLSKTTFFQRLSLIRKCLAISETVDCPHTQSEILSFITAFLSIPDNVPGCIVECGVFRGGSAAKFSLAASLCSRTLVIFDSFAGLPSHSENGQKNIFGEEAIIPPGRYAATLEEVRDNIERLGEIGICDFKRGWFDKTLPDFSAPIAALYLDVDLASSTKICLKFLYPQISGGGVLFSHDGHFPLVIEALGDDKFWENEVGCPKPSIEGLGRKKLVKAVKQES